MCVSFAYKTTSDDMLLNTPGRTCVRLLKLKSLCFEQSKRRKLQVSEHGPAVTAIMTTATHIVASEDEIWSKDPGAMS